MTNITKAAEMALAALLYVRTQTRPIYDADQAIEALRAALQDKAGEVRESVTCGNGCNCAVQCGDYYAHHGEQKPAQPAPVVPDGFALVPVEATFDMRAAGNIELDRLKNTPGMLVADRAFYVWSTMIAASQQKGGQHG